MEITTGTTSNWVCKDCGKPYVYVGDVFPGMDVTLLICVCRRCPVCGQPYPFRVSGPVYVPYYPWYPYFPPYTVSWGTG
jgi:hypothetical protein